VFDGAPSEGLPMAFRDMIGALRRGWLIVVLTAVAGCSIGLGYSLARTPEYVTASQLFLGVATASGGETSRQDTLYLQQRMQSYAAVLGSPALGERVADELGLQLSGTDVAGRMTVDSPEGTVLLDVTVRDSSAERAQGIANAVGDEFADLLAELEDAGGTDIDAVDVTTIQPARLPTDPASPDVAVNVLSGLLLGSIVGIGLMFLREALDDRIRGADDLLALGLRPLGQVPRRRQRGRSRPQGTREDAVRRLRLRLSTDRVDGGKERGALAITAPTDDVDVAVLAVDLAVVMSAAGRSVILVDGDLRTRRLTSFLGIGNDAAGFAELLAGKVDAKSLLMDFAEGARVLPAGHSPHHPADLITPERMTKALSELVPLADVVVVVAPPLDGPPDAEVIASTDVGAVLLLGQNVTRRAHARRALRSLGALGADVVGAVLERKA
jgi:capsular polysaccharide biosynthesis protein/Mrp family chromosome partitioning ATPase